MWEESMKLVLALFVCASVLAGCQTNQGSGSMSSGCQSTGAGGTTDVICPD
jgi:predicted small secreted protein